MQKKIKTHLGKFFSKNISYILENFFYIYTTYEYSKKNCKDILWVLESYFQKNITKNHSETHFMYSEDYILKILFRNFGKLVNLRGWTKKLRGAGSKILKAVGWPMYAWRKRFKPNRDRMRRFWRLSSSQPRVLFLCSFIFLWISLSKLP